MRSGWNRLRFGLALALLLVVLLGMVAVPCLRDNPARSAAKPDRPVALESSAPSSVPTSTVFDRPTGAAGAPAAQTAPATAPIRVEATISDPAPRRSARLTVTGRLLRGDTGIADVPIRTVWHFRSGEATCDQRGGTDNTGRAACTFSMSGALPGHEVIVEVIFAYEGRTYQTEVRFTPR